MGWGSTSLPFPSLTRGCTTGITRRGIPLVQTPVSNSSPAVFTGPTVVFNCCYSQYLESTSSKIIITLKQLSNPAPSKLSDGNREEVGTTCTWEQYLKLTSIMYNIMVNFLLLIKYYVYHIARIFGFQANQSDK